MKRPTLYFVLVVAAAAVVVVAAVSVFVLTRQSPISLTVSEGFAAGSILSSAAATSPPVVQTNPASGITTASAALNGNLTDLGTTTSVTVGFLWGTSSTLVGATNATAGTQTAPGAFTDGLTGLTLRTTYYFRAWANGNGFAEGAILSFEPDYYPLNVTTEAASGITATGATLNGYLVSPGPANTVATGFLYGTSPSLAGATNLTGGTIIISGVFAYVLTGLSPVTTYYFEAWANGQSFALGGILSFTTSTLPPSVASMAATGNTTKAATLNGNLTDLGTATTVTVGFLWGTSLTLSVATNTTGLPETAATTFSDVLSGLTMATTYYFRAWANGDGFSEGSIVSFTTGTTYPQVTTDPASAVVATGANLNGHTTSIGTATTITVGFLWSTSLDFSGATNVTVRTESANGTFTYALANLRQGTTYYFEAWALGNGFVHGTIQSFTTTNSGTSGGRTLLGLPAWEGYLVVVVVIIVVVAGLLVVLMVRRGRKSPPEIPSPPLNP